MPTTKEIEDAQQRIHDLLDARYVERENGVDRIASGMEAPENAVGFADLGEGDRLTLLAFDHPWSGFSTDQAFDVMDRVMEGHASEQWMDGIVASDHQALMEEVRSDEHAARVRDFGEEDAAGYADRMVQAFAVQADALGPEKPPSPPITQDELDEIELGWPSIEQLVSEATRYHGHAREEDLER